MMRPDRILKTGYPTGGSRQGAHEIDSKFAFGCILEETNRGIHIHSIPERHACKSVKGDAVLPMTPGDLAESRL